MTTYGFCGLGIMGREMAGRLLRAGHAVHVWNRTGERSAALRGLGAVVAASPAAVVSASGITFAMVADPQASRNLCFGENGVLAAITAGRSYVDCSTIDADTSVAIGAAVREAGGRYLEAPVSGSKKPAADGTLAFLCAGDESLYRDALPAFEAMGKRSFYFGETGRGANMKLLNNMIMGTMMTALAEGLSLAQKAGLEPAGLLDVLAAGAVANPMFALKGPLMLGGEFSPAFPLRHMAKDMRLALELGKSAPQRLRTAEAAAAAFGDALAAGLGDQDFAAVLQAVRGT